MVSKRLVGLSDARLAASSDLAVARGQIEQAGDDLALTPAADEILAFVDSHPAALERRCMPGHLTGSALVVDADARVAAVLFHTKLFKWLQPGGHADGEANLARVALLEATEETGIEGLMIDPEPVDLDVHAVAPPWEEPHSHYDVRFLVVAPAGAEMATNHESMDSRWAREWELVELGADGSLQRLARHGFRRAAELLRIERDSTPPDVVLRAVEVARAIQAGRVHPYSAAMRIWNDLREHDGAGYRDLRAFVSLASAWQVNVELRDAIEITIGHAAAQLIEDFG